MSDNVLAGVVQEFGTSKGGKPKVRVDGEWYFVSEGVDLSSVHGGDRIEFDWHPFTIRGVEGSFKSLDNWRSVKPVAPQPGELKRTEESPVLSVEQWRLISNVMAALASQGKITKPDEIKGWFEALKASVQGTEFFDSHVPY